MGEKAVAYGHASRWMVVVTTAVLIVVTWIASIVLAG
jgi:hypothetical protein